MTTHADIAEIFRKLSPKTKLPLGTDETGTVIVDAEGRWLAKLHASTFLSGNITVTAGYIDSWAFANLVTTAVNTMAGYTAHPDGTWTKP